MRLMKINGPRPRLELLDTRRPRPRRQEVCPQRRPRDRDGKLLWIIQAMNRMPKQRHVVTGEQRHSRIVRKMDGLKMPFW